MTLLTVLAALALFGQDASNGMQATTGNQVTHIISFGEPVKAGPHVPMPEGSLSGVKIKLTRTGCYGSCPDYSVEIRGDGRITFVGNDYTIVRGKHVARIAPEAVASLVRRFREADFWSLAPAYEAAISDRAAYTTTLVIGGKRKTVRDYFGEGVGMPEAMTALEKAIDETGDTARWVVGDDNTLAALKAEQWDFRSPEAAWTLAAAAGTAPDALVLGLLDMGVSPVRPRKKSGDRTGHGISALENAASRGRLETVRALLAANAPVDGNILGAAAGSGRPEVAAEILKHWSDVNSRGRSDQTPLMRAASGTFEEEEAGVDRPASIRLLVGAGADVLAVDGDGKTALHRAEDAAVVRALIAAGAQVDARDHKGETPLFEMIDEVAAKALIAAGADIDARDEDGQTALMTTFSEEVALLLLDAGAKPNDAKALIDRARSLRWGRVLERLGAK